MPFNTSSFNQLTVTALALEEVYAEEKMKASPNFFMGWFPPQPNPERLQYINFIMKLTKNIDENKLHYNQMDPEHYHQDYRQVIRPFLNNVLAGALLYILIKISDSYFLESSVKDRSALGRILLGVFDINALSEVPIEERKKCLAALKQYMKAIDKDSYIQGVVQQWHPTRTNADLYEDITLAIEPSSPAYWRPASLLP